MMYSSRDKVAAPYPSTSSTINQNLQPAKSVYQINDNLAQNYHPSLKQMIFSSNNFSNLVRNKIKLLKILLVFMIIGPLLNVILCSVELVFKAVPQPTIKLILSIIFLFVWVLVGFVHFYHGFNLLTQLQGSGMSYSISAFVICIRFSIWSIVDWADANGFISTINLFKNQKTIAGILSIFYIILTIPVAILSLIGIFFIWKR